MGGEPPAPAHRPIGDVRLGVAVADITALAVDTIVNTANPSLLGGGVDVAIHCAPARSY